jgi:hypothetical protein
MCFKRSRNSRKLRCDDSTPRAASVGTHIIMMKMTEYKSGLFSSFAVCLSETGEGSNLVNRPHYQACGHVEVLAVRTSTQHSPAFSLFQPASSLVAPLTAASQSHSMMSQYLGDLILCPRLRTNRIKLCKI